MQEIIRINFIEKEKDISTIFRKVKRDTFNDLILYYSNKYKPLIIELLGPKFPLNTSKAQVNKSIVEEKFKIEHLTSLICLVIKSSVGEKNENNKTINKIDYTIKDFQLIFTLLDKEDLKQHEQYRESYNRLLNSLIEENHPFGKIQIDGNWNLIKGKCKPVQEIKNYLINFKEGGNTKRDRPSKGLIRESRINQYLNQIHAEFDQIGLKLFKSGLGMKNYIPRYWSKTVKTNSENNTLIEISNFLSSENDIFINANAGQGKTTLMHWGVFSLSDDATFKKYKRIPIYIPLIYCDKPFNQYIDQILNKYKITLIDLKEFQTVLFIDGSDEYSFHNNIQFLISELEQFKKEHNCKIIFCGRFSPNQLSNQGYNIYYLNEMNESEKLKLLDSYSSFIYEKENEEFKIDEVVENLKTPLLINLLGIVMNDLISNKYDQKEIINLLTSNGLLFKRVLVDKFIKDYEGFKKGKKQEIWNYKKEKQILLIAFLAYKITLSKKQSESLDYDKCQKIISQYIKNNKGFDMIDVENLLSDFIEHGILSFNYGMLGFSNKEFKTFFVAYYIATGNKSPNEFIKTSLKVLKKPFDSDQQNPWMEVAKYFSGILNSTNIINSTFLNFNEDLLVYDNELALKFSLAWFDRNTNNQLHYLDTSFLASFILLVYVNHYNTIKIQKVIWNEETRIHTLQYKDQTNPVANELLLKNFKFVAENKFGFPYSHLDVSITIKYLKKIYHKEYLKIDFSNIKDKELISYKYFLNHGYVPFSVLYSIQDFYITLFRIFLTKGYFYNINYWKAYPETISRTHWTGFALMPYIINLIGLRSTEIFGIILCSKPDLSLRNYLVMLKMQEHIKFQVELDKLSKQSQEKLKSLLNQSIVSNTTSKSDSSIFNYIKKFFYLSGESHFKNDIIQEWVNILKNTDNYSYREKNILKSIPSNISTDILNYIITLIRHDDIEIQHLSIIIVLVRLARNRKHLNDESAFSEEEFRIKKAIIKWQELANTEEQLWLAIALFQAEIQPSNDMISKFYNSFENYENMYTLSFFGFIGELGVPFLEKAVRKKNELSAMAFHKLIKIDINYYEKHFLSVRSFYVEMFQRTKELAYSKNIEKIDSFFLDRIMYLGDEKTLSLLINESQNINKQLSRKMKKKMNYVVRELMRRWDVEYYNYNYLYS